MKDGIQARIKEYTDLILKLNRAHKEQSGLTYFKDYATTVTYGPRYARVAVYQVMEDGSGHHKSLHSFVDLENGNILKGGWKAPVKNGVRGNIYSADLGASKINHFGPNYLR